MKSKIIAVDHRVNSPNPEVLNVKTIPDSFHSRLIYALQLNELLSQRLPEEKLVTVFGGGSFKKGDLAFDLAEQVGGAIAQKKWAALTGIGWGIMDAISSSAKSVYADQASLIKALGVFFVTGNQDVFLPPVNSRANVTERILAFLNHSDAFIRFPGGIGVDEEDIMLRAALLDHRIPLRPVVYMLSNQDNLPLFPRGIIYAAKDVNDAISHIEHFYHNVSNIEYIRDEHGYVSEVDVFLNKKSLSDEAFMAINKKSADLFIKLSIIKNNDGIIIRISDLPRQFLTALRDFIDLINDLNLKGD